MTVRRKSIPQAAEETSMSARKARALEALSIALAPGQASQRTSRSATAKRLGISSSLLSLVLSGKRPMSANVLIRLEAAYSLQNSEAPAVRDLRAGRRYPSPEFQTVPSEKLELEWLDFAVADLLTLAHARDDVRWIARTLSVSIAAASESLERGLAVGLLLERDGRIRKAKSKIQRRTTRSLDEVRRYLREGMARATRELERTDERAFTTRHMVGMTIAANPKHFAEAERRIEAFHQELADLLTRGKCTELYQLGFQLFPISRED